MTKRMEGKGARGKGSGSKPIAYFHSCRAMLLCASMSGEEKKLRVILFTGKGGVGKTSLSAATGVQCARKGLKTIVLSTDAAHSLGDVLDCEIGAEPREIEPNLTAFEVSVQSELRRNWGRIQKYLTRFLASQGYQEAVAEELAVAIIDCAPTGSTLQLLSLADILQWYMEKFYNIEKKIALAIKPIAEKIIKAPMPDKGVYSSVEAIYRRIIEVRDLLTDPKQSSIRLITNPEKIVIRETQRAYTYLCLYGFPVDAVIVNRVLPKNLAKGYFKDWVRLQKEYLGQIETAFSPLPILTTPMYPREMLGPGDLAQMAETAYGTLPAEEVLWEGRPFALSGEPGSFQMDIPLPGVERDQIDLWAKADELIITIGRFQRNLILPRALEGHIVTKAKMKDSIFQVTFEKEN